MNKAAIQGLVLLGVAFLLGIVVGSALSFKTITSNPAILVRLGSSDSAPPSNDFVFLVIKARLTKELHLTGEQTDALDKEFELLYDDVKSIQRDLAPRMLGAVTALCDRAAPHLDEKQIERMRQSADELAKHLESEIK